MLPARGCRLPASRAGALRLDSGSVCDDGEAPKGVSSRSVVTGRVADALASVSAGSRETPRGRSCPRPPRRTLPAGSDGHQRASGLGCPDDPPTVAFGDRGIVIEAERYNCGRPYLGSQAWRSKLEALGLPDPVNKR